MKKRYLVQLGAVAAALAVVLVGVTPANASPPETTGLVSKTSVVLKNKPDVPATGELDEDGKPVPVIPPALLQKLHDEGLEGDVTSVQKGDGGGTFYGGENGSWVIDLTPPTTPGQVTAAFSYGFCVGYFNNIQKVSNYLQWGAQSSCSASDNQY